MTSTFRDSSLINCQKIITWPPCDNITLSNTSGFLRIKLFEKRDLHSFSWSHLFYSLTLLFIYQHSLGISIILFINLSFYLPALNSATTFQVAQIWNVMPKCKEAVFSYSAGCTNMTSYAKVPKNQNFMFLRLYKYDIPCESAKNQHFILSRLYSAYQVAQIWQYQIPISKFHAKV